MMTEINRKKGSARVNILNKNVSIGVELDGKGKVKKIQPSSVFLGIIFTNDIIISVADIPVQTTADFFNAVRKNIPGKVAIEYDRDVHYTATFKRLETVRPNTERMEVELVWRSGGCRIGMLIHRDFEGRVIVSLVEDGGAASSYVKPGDHLIKVNKVDITDREKARSMIMKSINDDKKVSITLERAVAQKSLMIAPSVIVQESVIEKFDKKDDQFFSPPAAQKSTLTEPSKIMELQKTSQMVSSTFKPLPPYPVAEDVIAILRDNMNFYKESPTTRGCLVVGSASVSMSLSNKLMLSTEKPQEQMIICDPSTKDLKITPKRVGSS